VTRRWCVNDRCSGQQPQMARGYAYLVRFSTTQAVHTFCPHCRESLADRAPRDCGMRELGPTSAAEQVRELVASGRTSAAVAGSAG
jgi:hypothetical protein